MENDDGVCDDYHDHGALKSLLANDDVCDCHDDQRALQSWLMDDRMFDGLH